MEYQLLKTVHILSAIVLFGTGLGSAWYKWMADRSGNLQQIAMTNRHVVLADWLFTTPTVILQPVTGVLLLRLLHIPLTTDWVIVSIILYVIAGACWLPVVWLQIAMQELSRHAFEAAAPLSPQYWRFARLWFWLGVPAFGAMLLVVALMVFKPW